MRLANIFRILGLLLSIFSFSMLPPMAVDLFYQEEALFPFGATFIVSLLIGLLIWLPHRQAKQDLRARDGFVIVVLFWAVLCLIGALPFILADNPVMTLTDAVFESISGLTTTGATVIPHLDALPHAILYYRQQLQMLGGLGIIILAVAILPMLGVGGMQLFRAEATGPIKDNKLTPRITETAKALWFVYLGLTLLCILAYLLCGMEPFDALCYAFSTMTTGGFAPHDESLGYFSQASVRFVCIFFMLVSSISFPLHFVALRKRQLSHYAKDDELLYFLLILGVSIALLFLLLFFSKVEGAYFDTLFHVVSFLTTTGLAVSDHSQLPGMGPLLLLFLGVIGGCAGSTSGGIKIIRFVLLQKQGLREIKRLIHPQGKFAITFQSMPISDRIIQAIWGFFALYVALFAFFFLLLLCVEADFLTAYTVVIACFSNIGPALGEASQNYAQLHVFSKWVLSFAMLVGRLEMLTVLVVFSPAFWRH